MTTLVLDTPTAALHHGKLELVLPTLEPASVDAVICDPPYELGFMGRGWDRSGVAFQVATWELAHRVLKPGGHLLAFGGTRTWHRLAVAIEDAGFEIRDTLLWLYGSGFPKSLDVGKALDKAAGAEREVVGQYERPDGSGPRTATMGKPALYGEYAGLDGDPRVTAPATDLARQWDGWGTALKPAWEPIIMARKPLVGTVAANVAAHGTGGLNIDGCRIGRSDDDVSGWSVSGSRASENRAMSGPNYQRDPKPDNDTGRWPANVILDEEAAALLDEQSGILSSGRLEPHHRRHSPRLGSNTYGDDPGTELSSNGGTWAGDTGGASRFFYCAKASRAERNAGLAGMPEQMPHPPASDGRAWDIGGSLSKPRANHHPTVKPVALMRWLCRMVTPPGGLILDPFLGSGSTGVAAIAEGMRITGTDLTAEYVAIAVRRIQHAQRMGRQIAMEL